MSKLKVGDTVVVEEISAIRGDFIKVSDEVISKVDKKYFYLEGKDFKQHRFNIETLENEKVRSFRRFVIYLSHAERDEKKQKSEIRGHILGKLWKLSLLQLQQIQNIIGNE